MSVLQGSRFRANWGFRMGFRDLRMLGGQDFTLLRGAGSWLQGFGLRFRTRGQNGIYLCCKSSSFGLGLGWVWGCGGVGVWVGVPAAGAGNCLGGRPGAFSLGFGEGCPSLFEGLG